MSNILTQEQIIAKLNLKLLPHESGYFVPTYESDKKITDTDINTTLPACNSIYYLLNKSSPINYLHKLNIDDNHIILEGGPVDYYIFYPNGNAEKITLGRDISKGERYHIHIPAYCSKALVLKSDYALMANILTPGFTTESVTIGADNDFIEKYLNSKPWCNKKHLMRLIGPNFNKQLKADPVPSESKDTYFLYK